MRLAQLVKNTAIAYTYNNKTVPVYDLASGTHVFTHQPDLMWAVIHNQPCLNCQPMGPGASPVGVRIIHADNTTLITAPAASGGVTATTFVPVQYTCQVCQSDWIIRYPNPTGTTELNGPLGPYETL